MKIKNTQPLAEGVTQETIDAAKELVNKVTDTTKKEELLNEMVKAQELLDKKNEAAEKAAEESVNNLFGDKKHTTLAEGVTQETIDAAKELVNKVTDITKKEELLNEMVKAQELLDKKNEAAKKAAEESVNNLFGDKEHTTLAEGVTQETIDAAKELVNKVTDITKKEELLNEIQKAQKLLGEKNKEEAALEEAQKNVNDLFGDEAHKILADSVTQEDIDAAKEAANKVKDRAKKEELLNEIVKAQELLNKKQEEAQKTSLVPNTYQLGNSTITGTYAGNTLRASLYINGKYVSRGGTFSKNKFSYYVKGKIKAGDKVELAALDHSNNEIIRKEVVIVTKPTTGTLIVNLFEKGSSKITGRYTGDVASAQLVVNGKLIVKGGTFKSGQFSFYAKGKFIDTDKVELVALDKAGNELDRQAVVFNENVGLTITPFK